MEEIPKGHFVVACDLDCDKPYFDVAGEYFPVPIRHFIPVELAVYLRTHWCGSRQMHEMIVENTRREIGNTIKEALGL